MCNKRGEGVCPYGTKMSTGLKGAIFCVRTDLMPPRFREHNKIMNVLWGPWGGKWGKN